MHRRSHGVGKRHYRAFLSIVNISAVLFLETGLTRMCWCCPLQRAPAAPADRDVRFFR